MLYNQKIICLFISKGTLMGKLEEAMKAEIARLARKEAKTLLKDVKEQVRKLKKEVTALKKASRRREKAAKENARKLSRVYTPELLLEPQDPETVENSRLSPGLIRKLRRKLKITQANLADLVGVSVNSIVNWEKGRTNPSEEYKAKIIALRQYGRTDVRDMLEEFETEQTDRIQKRTKTSGDTGKKAAQDSGKESGPEK
jgi:DNA-binding transcriptional regulator YiaG